MLYIVSGAAFIILVLVAHSVFKFEQLLRCKSEQSKTELSEALTDVLLKTLRQMDAVHAAEERAHSDDDAQLPFDVLRIQRIELDENAQTEVRLFVERPMSLMKLVFRGDDDDTLRTVTLESLKINDVEMLTRPTRLSTLTELSASGEYAFTGLGMIVEAGDDVAMRFQNHGPRCEFNGFLAGRKAVTYGDDASETSFLRPPMNGSSTHGVDEQDVVMTLAFAIEDPCGTGAIQVARELLRFGRGIPPEARTKAIALMRSWDGALPTYPSTIPSASNSEVQ